MLKDMTPEPSTAPKLRLSSQKLELSLCPEAQKRMKNKSKNSKNDSLMCQAKEIFQMYDLDGSEYLDLPELQRALEEWGEKSDLNTVLNWMEQADLNCDGKVDFGEFVRLLEAYSLGRDDGNKSQFDEKRQRGPYKEKLNTAFTVMADKADGVESIQKLKIEQMISDFDLSMKIRSPKKSLSLQEFCDEFTKSTPRTSFKSSTPIKIPE